MAQTGVNVSTNGGSTAFSAAVRHGQYHYHPNDIAPVVDLNGPGAGNNNTVSYPGGNTTIQIAPSATITDPTRRTWCQ